MNVKKDTSIYEPNCTQIPNEFLDNLPSMTDAEVKIMMALCRETLGWNKPTEQVSAKNLATFSGTSEEVANHALAGLERLGYVEHAVVANSPLFSVVFED